MASVRREIYVLLAAESLDHELLGELLLLQLVDAQDEVDVGWRQLLVLRRHRPGDVDLALDLASLHELALYGCRSTIRDGWRWHRGRWSRDR